jgi:hypothetical protein
MVWQPQGFVFRYRRPILLRATGRPAKKVSPTVLIGASPIGSISELSRGGITIMQSPESRAGVDRAISPIVDRCGPTYWCILRESEVGPIFVVANVFGHQPLEMPLVQDDDVYSSPLGDSLRDPVLPRTAKSRTGMAP